MAAAAPWLWRQLGTCWPGIGAASSLKCTNKRNPSPRRTVGAHDLVALVGGEQLDTLGQAEAAGAVPEPARAVVDYLATPNRWRARPGGPGRWRAVGHARPSRSRRRGARRAGLWGERRVRRHRRARGGRWRQVRRRRHGGYRRRRWRWWLRRAGLWGERRVRRHRRARGGRWRQVRRRRHGG